MYSNNKTSDTMVLEYFIITFKTAYFLHEADKNHDRKLWQTGITGMFYTGHSIAIQTYLKIPTHKYV